MVRPYNTRYSAHYCLHCYLNGNTATAQYIATSPVGSQHSMCAGHLELFGGRYTNVRRIERGETRLQQLKLPNT